MPGNIRRRYRLEFETLTPLHTSLGPETPLIPDLECDVEGATTYVLDRPRLIAEFQAHPPGPPAPPRRGTYRDILTNPDHPTHALALQMYRAGWIKPDDPVEDEGAAAPAAGPPDWRRLALAIPRQLPRTERRWLRDGGERFVRYRLDGTPDVPGIAGGAWWQAVSRLPRTPDGAILLPGSGIKGALRSALAYAVARSADPRALPQRNGTPKYAAQPLERRLLAPGLPRQSSNAPNYDAGRLLLPRDARLDTDVRARIAGFGILTRTQWRTFPGGGTPNGGAAALEVVPAGAAFVAGLGVDTHLLERWGGVFAPFRTILAPDLAPLLAAANAFARQIAEADVALFAEARDGAAPLRATESVRARLDALEPGQCVLRLGWGTGRMAKTPFDLLLGGAPPRSRRVTIAASGAPDAPLGWAVCTVRPVAASETD